MVKRNPLIRTIPKMTGRGTGGHKSAGILDDFAVRKSIDTQVGTITKTPTDNNDIANKGYVDAQVAIHSASSVDTLTNKTMDSFTNLIHSDVVHIQIRNESGSTMSFGDVVYISGYSVGQDLPLVSLADANGSGTFPALGLVNEVGDIANNATGQIIISGRISGIDTSGFSAGDSAYLSETAGELNSKPTGNDSKIQAIGIVLRSHATLGVLEIIGAGRTNDVPTLPMIIWRLNADITNSQTPLGSAGGKWEIADDTKTEDQLGSTSVTESSGIFTFTSTGYWNIRVTGAHVNTIRAEKNCGISIKATQDASAYSTVSSYVTSFNNASDFASGSCGILLKIEDVANDKVQFGYSAGASGTRARGATGSNETHVVFEKKRDL